MVRAAGQHPAKQQPCRMLSERSTKVVDRWKRVRRAQPPGPVMPAKRTSELARLQRLSRAQRATRIRWTPLHHLRAWSLRHPPPPAMELVAPLPAWSAWLGGSAASSGSRSTAKPPVRQFLRQFVVAQFRSRLRSTTRPTANRCLSLPKVAPPGRCHSAEMGASRTGQPGPARAGSRFQSATRGRNRLRCSRPDDAADGAPGRCRCRSGSAPGNPAGLRCRSSP